MMGREAYQNPYLLAEVDQLLFGANTAVTTREDVMAALIPYIVDECGRGAQLNHITRHILGLYQSVPGARKFRRHLSENAYKKEADISVLQEAIMLVHEQAERMSL